MGNLKSRWSKGTLIFIIAIGFLFAGVFVSHYFLEKYASKSIIHQKNESINRAFAKEPTSDTIVRDTRDLKLEKELIQKQYEKAMTWRNNQDREKSNVPETTTENTTETTAEQPATNDTASSQSPSTESNVVVSGQNNTPPAGNESKKTIFLTFDDGPSPYSGEIIANLEKYQYKATFFMIDGNIRKYPDAVKLMVQAGETVGLHSVSHNPKVFYASANSVITELTQNRNTLKEISGIESYIMRTPYGSVPYMTEEYRNAVVKNGYLMWDWNIDSRDWDYKDARFVNSVKEQLSKFTDYNGPIVILMHERKETAAYLPQLLDYLTAQGYDGKAIDSSMEPFQFKIK
jgi:peptidoglycan/xylan/chitin deacetylase (PgdA/CDA1 family)